MTEDLWECRISPGRERLLRANAFGAFRADAERAGEREQEARVATDVVGRAIAERESDADAGLQILGEEEARADAHRGQRDPVLHVIAVVPDDAAIEEAVELNALQVRRV